MNFDIDDQDTFVVKYRDHFKVHETTVLNFTKISQETRFETIADHHNDEVSLGETVFTNRLIVNSSKLVIY